jgi:cytochrome c oxidase assembly protein subunit 15
LITQNAGFFVNYTPNLIFLKSFKTFLILSLITVYGLMFIGGLVRSTGSGMGCPDWPKCFGRWIPPTEASELPSNYREIYSKHGYSNQPFNAFKTWTEYLNRLFGILTGFFILGLAITSIRFRKSNKVLTYLSILTLVLVVFQGWLGGRVVDSNLRHIMVTYHFLIAFSILVVLIWLLVGFNKKNLVIEHLKKLKINSLILISTIGLVVLLIQVISGTQVRSEIDTIAIDREMLLRNEWVENAIYYFPIHRTLSILVTLISIFIIYKTWIITKFADGFRKASIILVTCLIGQIVTGTILYKFGFPAQAQPFHILFGSGMFGSMVFMIIFLILAKQSEPKNILS